MPYMMQSTRTQFSLLVMDLLLANFGNEPQHSPPLIVVEGLLLYCYKLSNSDSRPRMQPSEDIAELTLFFLLVRMFEQMVMYWI